MQQRNINKDFRILFGGIFIVPFLGPALGYLTVQCAARGGEIWLHLNGMICPWAVACARLSDSIVRTY